MDSSNRKVTYETKIIYKKEFRKYFDINLWSLICVLLFNIFVIKVGASIVWDIENNLNVRVNDHGFELTQANNLQRQEMIQNVCDSMGYNDTDNLLNSIPDDQLDHLLIDTKHKFLYCYVPKVSFFFSIINSNGYVHEHLK